MDSVQFQLRIDLQRLKPAIEGKYSHVDFLAV